MGEVADEGGPRAAGPARAEGASAAEKARLPLMSLQQLRDKQAVT